MKSNPCIYSLFFVVCLCFFSSCREENRVDRSKSRYYFYSKDNTQILYDEGQSLFTQNYKEVPADVSTFEPISAAFGKDDKHVFFKDIKLENGDAATIYWDQSLDLAKDRTYAYFPNPKGNRLVIIEDADPETYRKVVMYEPCLHWFFDKNHYFYNHRKTEADRETLCFDCPFFPYDKNYIYFVVSSDEEKVVIEKMAYTGAVTVINDKMVHDDRYIYFTLGCDSAILRLVEFKAIESFQIHDYEHSIFEIDKLIYFAGIRMLLDAASFEVLRSSYSKDKDKVLYGSIVIEGADPETFVVLNSTYTKDKNHVYENGEILNQYKPEEFVEDEWGRYPPDSEYGKEPRRYRRSRDDDD